MTIINIQYGFLNILTERLVEIAITKEVRDELKALKRELTYDKFFQKILELPNVRKVTK